MGKFVITKRKNNEFQFSLKASNGQAILDSEGYKTKLSCINGIKSVMKNATETIRFDKKVSTNKKFYFNLKARNGQIIGTSEMYESEAARDNGIASVAKNVIDAITDDQTL